MKLETWHSHEDKLKWKVVNTSGYTDIPGNIITADEATGEYSLDVGGEIKSDNLGPGGIRIVLRRR